MVDTRTPLAEVQARLPPAVWDGRVREAQEEGLLLERVLERVRSGTGQGVALRETFPDRPLRTVSDRLVRYQAGGWEGLISRRTPPPREVVTPEAMQMVRAWLILDPELRSPALAAALAKAGIVVAESTLREHLHAAGLSHTVGRPAGRPSRRAQPLPLAGAELWKAVDLDIGAVQHLTEQVGRHLESLPEPKGEVLDDCANRDERGRFLPEYNVAAPRTEPELGAKFDSVERHRAEKDLGAMRVANSSFAARYRKDLALTMLPIVVDAPRWTVLQHWQGDQLGELVGIAYQPATLDKHARELKLAGASGPVRAAMASFWHEREGTPEDETTGAALVYCDAATKPIWTHAFAKCAKVSSTNRVMPGTSTLFLHSGAGTPLLYQEYSGTVSVPQRMPELLSAYEAIAGEGTVRRVVVLDRESHAVWLFKELDARDWTYIVPLRSNVVGPNARFESEDGSAFEATWAPYGDHGDEVCDGWLWLNDARKGESAVRSRVVGRRRHRTGKVSWYATNAVVKEFGASDVVRLYFDRWPLQEHVFRAGSGRVGLDVHHGYGKRKITDVAVVDKLEKLSGRLRAMRAELAETQLELETARGRAQPLREEIGKIEAEVFRRGRELDAQLSAGEADQAFREGYRVHRALQESLPRARQVLATHEQVETDLARRVDALEASIGRADKERAHLESRVRIFTVDTELDQIMTAYKLTFMNVCRVLMREVLGEEMELETLIRGVLTLPGERVTTPKTETVRIFRQERDPRSMAAVERGCAYLNAKGLVRGRRTLRFELVDAP